MVLLTTVDKQLGLLPEAQKPSFPGPWPWWQLDKSKVSGRAVSGMVQN